MAGVVDGQAVSAAITNQAFLIKNADDSTTKKLGLLNDEPESGGHIVNLQRAVNKALSVAGSDGEDDTAANDYATEHRVENGQNRKEAIEAIDAAFDPTFPYDPELEETPPGHRHDGSPGQGPMIHADNIYYENGNSQLSATRVGHAIDEIKAILDNLPLKAEVVVDIQNNLVDEPIGDLVFNPVLHRTIFAKYDIARKSDTPLSEVREFGEIVFFYSHELDEWLIAGPDAHFWAPDGSAAENSGVTFSIETIPGDYIENTVNYGHVKVSSNEIAGDGYYGRANFRITEITPA